MKGLISKTKSLVLKTGAMAGLVSKVVLAVAGVFLTELTKLNDFRSCIYTLELPRAALHIHAIDEARTCNVEYGLFF